MNIIENGIEYEIQDGKVVKASATEAPEDVYELRPNDRVAHKNKLGTIVGILSSVYGDSAVVKFDDGSLDELHVDDLKLSNSKMASVEASDNLVDEYEAYLELPTDTAEEIALKESTARELNLRAKALATNGRTPLSEQINYDRIVTATAVDILDLHDAHLFARATEDSYIENLPQFRLPEEVSNAFGMNRGGDASWLFDAANEMEVNAHEDPELVQRANQAVAKFDRDQLEDDDLMDLALAYSTEELAAPDKSEKFAAFFKEARAQRLADEESFQKSASTDNPVDLDGNSFSLEDTPIEAIFGA